MAQDHPLSGSVLDMRSLRARHMQGGVLVSWHMIILLCGCDQCGLNVHSEDPDSLWIGSWSSVDRPSVFVFYYSSVLHSAGVQYLSVCVCFYETSSIHIKQLRFLFI